MTFTWLLAGAPNVGKSALFGRLTGLYATVSNYPGTSVEVTTGTRGAGAAAVEVSDTPGLYALLAVTEEERVARQAIFAARGAAVIHVVDASHLDRALPLTLQLLALGTPLVLACNHLDEARRRGVAPDLALLSERLGIPVVGTVATTGEGVEALAGAARLAPVPSDGWGLPQPFAAGVAAATDAEGAARLEAELALCCDADLAATVAERDPPRWRDAVEAT